MPSSPLNSRREALRRLLASVSAASAGSLVAACGGGGGSGTAMPDPSGAPAPAPGPSAPPPASAPSRFLYVANNPPPLNPANGVSAFAVPGAAGVPVPLGHQPFGDTAAICISGPNSGFLYAVDRSSDRVRTFKIDAATGGLGITSALDVSTGNEPVSVVGHPSGKFLYVASSSGTVFAYALDQTTGAPSLLQVFNLGAGAVATKLVMHQEGRFMLVAEVSTPVILVLSIATDGSISFSSSAPGSGQSGPMFFDPTGNFLFAGAWRSTQFACTPFDPTTGQLNPVSGSPIVVPAPSDFVRIAFHPVLQNCMYATFGTDAIWQLQFDARTASMSRVQALNSQGSQIRAVTVDPAGDYVYAADQSGSRVLAFSCDPSDGRLTPIGGVDTAQPVAFAFAVPT